MLLAQSADIAAGAGLLPEPLQVRPRPADLPALGLDDRLGRRRHQGAEQPQVRDLEQRRLLLRRARASPWSGRSRSTRRADPAAAAAYFVPLFTYIYVRNQTVPDDAEGAHPYHLGEVVNGLLPSWGCRPIFNQDDGDGRHAPGRRSTFIGKSQGAAKDDPSRVAPGRGVASRTCRPRSWSTTPSSGGRPTSTWSRPPEQLSVRYRIDGILHAAEPFDRPTGDAVINVFKVLAAMDISEKRKPQDGSFGAKLEGRELDFRVATSGSKAGEKLVMRILDNAAGVAKLDDVGHAAQAGRARSAAWSPSRTACSSAAGRPASGKTTTLYACLREIDRFQKNIITVEDPIEYHIDNITQMEINTKAARPSPAACGRSCGRTPT